MPAQVYRCVATRLFVLSEAGYVFFHFVGDTTAIVVKQNLARGRRKGSQVVPAVPPFVLSLALVLVTDFALVENRLEGGAVLLSFPERGGGR